MRLTSGCAAQNLGELGEIPGPRLLPRDRAVHRDVLTLDVLENAFVGRRRRGGRRARAAARRSTRTPADGGMFAHASGIGRTALVTTCMCTPIAVSCGSSDLELAESHERLAADDRQMQRPPLLDEIEHAVDEFLSLVVGELAQHDVAAEMRVAVRVTARTPERTLARDLDRQIRAIPLQDPAPGLDDGTAFHL